MADSGKRLRLDVYQMALLAAMAAWSALFATMAFQLHAGMRTHRADLGQIAQAVWNSSRGRFVEQTDNGFVATRLTDHVEPILSLISPVLWIWEDVRALLLLQVLFVAAGAWPLYHLALRRLDRALAPAERSYIWLHEPLRQSTRPLALGLALALLLAPQLQSAVLTEFHAAPLAVPMILWALWAVETRRWRQFAAAALLVALVKEEMALLAALLGLWAIWRAWRQRREGEGSMRWGLVAGAAVAALALAWFGVATFVIVPRHAAALYGVAESGYFARYGALGDSPADILRSLFTRPRLVWEILAEPARLAYLRHLIAPFAFLPLLAPELLLLSLPVLMANVLSAYPAQFYGEFHYSAPVVPYVAAAAAFGLARLWGWFWRRTQAGSPAFQHLPAAGAGAMAAMALARNPRTVLRPLLAAALVLWIAGWGVAEYTAAGRPPGGARHDPVAVTGHHRLLGRFLAQVPDDAAVTATAAVHPHLALRRFVYQFPLGLEKPTAGVEFEPASWALLDVTANTDMAPGDLRARVDAMLAGEWGVVDAADGYLLLAKGAAEKVIPAAFYGFARVSEPAAEPAGEIGSVVVTADDWPRWRQTRITVVWQPWQPAAGEQEITVVAPNGDAMATLATAAPPALHWLPPAEWQAGGGYRVTTLPLWLPRTSAVRVDGVLHTLLRRGEDGALTALPFAAIQQNDYAQALAALGADARTGPAATFAVEGSAQLRLTTLFDGRTPWYGDTVDQWLQWQGEAWPQGYVPFVHLRLDGITVAQQDGPPRLFAGAESPALPAGGGTLNDWRWLPLPAQAPAGEWTIVVGLYDPQSGERAPILAGGDELVVRRFRLATAVPDQACALNPASCASQPRPFR